MKKTLILALFLAFHGLIKAQSLDSIKYEHGYLYFHTYGQGEPVIILSGGPGNRCQQEEEVAIELSKKYKSILFEQRGTGLSIPVKFDSTTINLKSAIEDLNLLLKHLGLKKAIFYGHSWGATLAMSFATKYPQKIKKLILTGPGRIKSDEEFNNVFQYNRKVMLGVNDLERLEFLANKQETQDLNDAETAEQFRIFYTSYIYDKRNYDYLYEKIKTGRRNVKMNELMSNDVVKNLDLAEALKKYKKKVFIITGQQDPLAFNTYRLQLMMPNVEVDWIQQCGHFPMFEQPKEFYKFLFKRLEQK